MLKRPPITKEAVFAAADHIMDQGLVPTQRAILRRCGGSYSTIATFLDEWRKQKSATFRMSDSGVPDKIVDNLKLFATDLWAAALEMADAGLARERDDMARDRKVIMGDQQDARDLIDRMDEFAATQESRIRELEREVRDLGSLNASHSEKLSMLNERVTDADTRAKNSEDRIAVLTRELSQASRQNMDLVRLLTQMGKSVKTTLRRAS